jgi:MFS family permease
MEVHELPAATSQRRPLAAVREPSPTVACDSIGEPHGHCVGDGADWDLTLGNLVAAVMLIAYPLLALIFGALPSALWRVDRRLLLGVALVSATAMIAGAATAVRLFPVTDLVVAAFAAAGGIVAGRWFPPRARPMAIALALLAALDSIPGLRGRLGRP